MERTVPSATSEEIQLYRTTVYSLLRSSAEIKIRSMEEVHAGMKSLMHPGARDVATDVSALIYCIMRLPTCISRVRTVILGQNANMFMQSGYADLDKWEKVSARARRRRCFFDRKQTLACFIASRSDIEDVIPMLTAYQIEWNKMHILLQSLKAGLNFQELVSQPDGQELLAKSLHLDPFDLKRLWDAWGEDAESVFKSIQSSDCSFSVRLLNGSYSQYIRATHDWFEDVLNAFPDLVDRPVYFVSSNTHSLANLWTGYATRKREELVRFIYDSSDGNLREEWEKIQDGSARANEDNFLYYVLKKYQNTPAGQYSIQEQLQCESEAGIRRVASEKTFDVEAQVIELKKVKPEWLDGRISCCLSDNISDSDAVILNIDYPLGLAAYNLLATITIHICNLQGVYTMGKSASLNAARGDVIIPNIVQDEHSHNTYLFQNCFSATDVAPYLNYGSILDNQKALSVLGTFLQNNHLMNVFYREGFADIEMELGNFCSAIYEATRPKRHPLNEIVTLYNTSLDFGALHYVSDTPLAAGKTLGEGTLSYYGVDPTYACSLAILQRIFSQEQKRFCGAR